MFFFVLGLIVGSFLNVVIYRLPRGKSIISPRSFCPQCDKPIRYYDNIPLVSYILLKRKCRECGAIISVRYPLVELLTGFIFYSLYSMRGISFELFVLLVFVSLLIAVSFIDIDFKLIPDVLSLGGLVIGLIFSPFRSPYISFKDSLYGALLGGGILFAIATIYELVRKMEGLGFGDVKLLAMIGSFLGIRGALFSLIAGSFFGTIAGFVLILIQKGDLKSAIPFGPFLALGALIFIFFGDYLTWLVLRVIFAK